MPGESACLFACLLPCLPCPATGSYLDSPSASCPLHSTALPLLLQQHFFSATPGAKSCSPCPKGHETQDTGNSECSPCAKGYYNSVAGTSCDAAPAGTFVNSTAAVVFTAW